MSEPKQVFVSYSKSDSEFAIELAAHLGKLGVRPWLDEEELKPGDSWAEQIEAALRGSDAVVVVAGAGTPSANVLVEAGAALSQGIKIIPVSIDPGAEITGIFSELQVMRESKVEEAEKGIASIVRERHSGDH